jgi:glycosyltransferase involved in cell wall biosynthesis
MLDASLQSLVSQTVAPYEVVLVLDECCDEVHTVAEKFVSKFSNLHIVTKSRKTILAQAKNFGLKYCTGDWIAMQDADDLSLSCRLEVQRNFLLQRPDVDFLFALAWDDNGDSIWKPSCHYPGQYETHEQIEGVLTKENVLCHPSAMIRKSSLFSVGGYDNSMHAIGMEDWFLWRKAMARGCEFYNLPERLVVHRLGTSVARD